MISVTILNKIYPITPNKTLFLTSKGRPKKINKIRANCSKIFEIVLGATFNFPKKYPFKIDVMLVNGKVKAIAYKRGVTEGCFNKTPAIKGAQPMTAKMRKALNAKIKRKVEKTIFLLRIVFSLTSLEMLIGKAKEAKVIKRLKVGVTMVYKLIPSLPTILV